MATPKARSVTLARHMAPTLASRGRLQRALLVLDDPWMPEQVRFLNPVDDTQAENRLLVTTRLRGLVPRATRVALPLVGEESATLVPLPYTLPPTPCGPPRPARRRRALGAPEHTLCQQVRLERRRVGALGPYSSLGECRGRHQW